MFRKYVNIPVKLIESANNEGWLRSLGYFVRLKAAFKKPTFYNFSLRKASEAIKCSPATLAHHLRVLEAEGLVRYHSGNLTCMGKKDLKKKFGSRKVERVVVSKENGFDLLRSIVIKINLTRQAYQSRRNAGRISTPSFAPKVAKNSSVKDYVGLSCKKIGYLLNLGKSSGLRIRRKLENFGVVRSERVVVELFRGLTYSDYLELKRNYVIPYYSYYKRGSIYQPLHNRIEYIGVLKVV
jgi:DNA-binding Lrp family transcriptional regulator